jgi:hypothetical protein
MFLQTSYDVYMYVQILVNVTPTPVTKQAVVVVNTFIQEVPN